MKKKNFLKASILSTIFILLILILPISTVSKQETQLANFNVTWERNGFCIVNKANVKYIGTAPLPIEAHWVFHAEPAGGLFNPIILNPVIEGTSIFNNPTDEIPIRGFWYGWAGYFNAADFTLDIYMPGGITPDTTKIQPQHHLWFIFAFP